MFIALKTKIWLTVLSIVLTFSFFALYYFPSQQGELLLKNYNNEVQNLANTVALGVKIALKEQNFEGVETAMKFVNDDPRLQFVSMLQTDTVWNDVHSKYKIEVSVFKTFPEKEHPVATAISNDSIIVKQAPFVTSVMSGSIMLAFTTKAIIESKIKIRKTSLLVSAIVLFIGVIIGLWLSRSISVPVLALRNAAKRIGEGDLSQRVTTNNRDEIGELGKAFNKMTDDLSFARKELNETNASLSAANNNLNTTLSKLKSTQAQLIQSEKMASLGELTAGIAHEIQNPLNFVNNFSDINKELLTELKEEIQKGNTDEANAIADDVIDNEEKINHHGKRADAIVKGMLQHSRQTKGIKEPTDINALCDEYIRLSYHGLRAKDKSLNADFKTDFDESIGKINIVPQDVGRVLLNLINNAFYAVNEKKKTAGESYKPLVSILTKNTNSPLGDGGIEIKITDNGNGIPQHIIDKIFQPFFTTKPTGQGTGLGLSLSYDIIKAHKGELKVETKEGGGSTFTIQLPAN